MEPAASSGPQESRPWTRQEIAMHMAETWGEVDWSTSPTASLTAWDENISLALQDRELNHILGDDLVVPTPESLPMPFTTAADVEGESQVVAYLDSGEEQNMGPAADWWEAVRDKRVLIDGTTLTALCVVDYVNALQKNEENNRKLKRTMVVKHGPLRWKDGHSMWMARQ
eukprot:s265_g9.t1